MIYGLDIPTRDRPKVLSQCLLAFDRQTVRPALAIVINNNTDQKRVGLPHLSFPVEVHPNEHPIPGPEQAHQTSLQLFAKRKFGIVARWDDDLFPEPICMETLLSHFTSPRFNGMVGGCYPRPNSPVWEDGYKPGAFPPGGRTHIQFFRWGERYNEVPVVVRTLYSGFMYRTKVLIEKGGFCVQYSQLGYRGESDVSLRVGHCVIDPRAVAIHHCARGGVRSLSREQYKRMEQSDRDFFEQRMQELKISPRLI